MKQVLDAAGIRTPRHASTTTVAGVWEAAERIGYPIIVKPIAGAGSADTYRVDSSAELADVLPLLRHVPEVSVEEFIEAEEFTFDTVCADGEILFENMMWYRPRPLQMRLHEWVSPVSIVAARPRRCPTSPAAARWAAQVLAALGFRTGFTHMEWYRKADGEAVFGEIAARPPGARVVELMNYACDADLYVGWAEAVAARAPAHADRRSGSTRATSSSAPTAQGRITAVEGLDALLGGVRRARRERRPAAGRGARAATGARRRSATAASSSATTSCRRSSR